MLDLQLPRPLRKPDLWPTPGLAIHFEGDQGECGLLLSLSHFRYGGAFAKLRTGPLLAIAVQDNFWQGQALATPSFIPLLQTEFEKAGATIELVSRAPLDSEERMKWSELGNKAQTKLEFKTWPQLREPTLLEWSKELFPESFVALGELLWLHKLKKYDMQMMPSGSAPIPASIDTFRFWPGFLRTKKSEIADLAAFEWATAEALFSPQDETQMSSGDTVILNPTLQVVTDPKSSDLVAIWRLGHQLKNQQVTWQEAAVIDELRENPRLALQRLHSEISSKQFSLKATQNFNNVIDDMLTQGVILRRP